MQYLADRNSIAEMQMARKGMHLLLPLLCGQMLVNQQHVNFGNSSLK